MDGTDVLSAVGSVIVLTQTCDLVQPKRVEYVVVCPLFTDSEIVEYDPTLKKKLDQLFDNRIIRYHGLPACEIAGFEFTRSVVDFGLVYSAPIEAVKKIAAQSRRVTVCAPFRERMSQRFGETFSRVALPDE